MKDPSETGRRFLRPHLPPNSVNDPLTKAYGRDKFREPGRRILHDHGESMHACATLTLGMGQGRASQAKGFPRAAVEPVNVFIGLQVAIGIDDMGHVGDVNRQLAGQADGAFARSDEAAQPLL